MIRCLLGDSKRTTASLESQPRKRQARRANQASLKEEGFMTVISQCRQRSAFFAAAIAALLGLATTPVTFANDDFRISTLSTRPELVSGGDVLVRVEVPRKVLLQSVRVELNGRNISGAFRADATGRSLTGLVTGLKLGKNSLEASVRDRKSTRLNSSHGYISYAVFCLKKKKKKKKAQTK